MTFNALVKIYSTKYFCNTKVAGLGESFVQQKFLVILYIMVLDLYASFSALCRWNGPLSELNGLIDVVQERLLSR